MFPSFLLLLLVRSLVEVCITSAEQQKPHIFVHQCMKENPDRPSTYVLYTILSRCHLKNGENLLRQNETTRTKPIPHFSHHSYVIKFEDILTLEEAEIFRVLYERLFLTLAQRNLFEFIGTRYRELQQYNPYEVKQELLRRRWNLDEFIIVNSPGARRLLLYNEDQLPTFLQKQDERYKTNNLSGLALAYYITSGYGQRCVHNSRDEKLASLTYDFTAYDRLFCDAFEYHGLQHTISQYWNLYDMYYWRGRLVRDGLVSSFPPDTSHAVYYACPKLTFVVLQRKPITWLFVVRPFNKSLWIFLIVTFTALEIIRHLKQFIQYMHDIRIKRKMIMKNLFAIIIDGNEMANLEVIGKRHLNMLGIFNGIMRIMLASAYSGMILVGILHPLFPWVPETFKDLNNTDNYFVGTAIHSPFFITSHLKNSYKLNRVKPEMIQERTRNTPAEYLEYSESSEFTDVKENKNKFYAAVMYDDKMNLWMKGRFIIWRTASFLERMQPASDKVLPEIRYVSVAPGATRLHFLMDTMKRVFTSGTWMRWYHLEQNYYKNVAPVIAVKKLRESGKEVPRDVHERRSLNLDDLSLVFALKVLALGFAFFVCMFELYTTCSYTEII